MAPPGNYLQVERVSREGTVPDLAAYFLAGDRRLDQYMASTPGLTLHFTRNYKGRQLPSVANPHPNRILVFGQPVESKTNEPSLRDIADHVARILGCQTFPVDGKIPSQGHNWRYGKFRLTPGVQEATSKAWAKATGYGILAVPGSDLVIIDCDGQAFLARLLTEFPHLLLETPVTYSGDIMLAVDGHLQIIVRLTLIEKLDSLLSVQDELGQEIGSLRGVKSYGLGPGSLHPASGSPYHSNSISVPRRLDLAESARLLALFQAAKDRPRAIRTGPGGGSAKADDIALVAAMLRSKGYKENKVWLNGPCLWPEHHKHADAHPSAGFNTLTGVWHCFEPGCSNHNLNQVMAALEVQGQSAPPGSGRLYTFAGALPSDAEDQALVEINLAVALIRQKKYMAAKFYEILRDYSRRNGGIRTFRASDLIALGKSYGMSQDEVKKAQSQLVQVELLHRPRRGLYVRIGLVEAQRRLGLGNEYAAAPLPTEALRGSPSDYSKAVLLAVQGYLPAGLPSATIGQAAGRSRSSLYNHENALGIGRERDVRRTGIAPASGPPSFITVCGADGQVVVGLDGDDVDGAIRMATRLGGKPWAWQQRPSKRFLPPSS